MDQQPVLRICREVGLQLGLEKMLAKPLENHLSRLCPLGALQCPSSFFLSGASQLLGEEVDFYGAFILYVSCILSCDVHVGILVETVSRVINIHELRLHLMVRMLVKRPTCSWQSRVSSLSLERIFWCILGMQS